MTNITIFKTDDYVN